MKSEVIAKIARVCARRQARVAAGLVGVSWTLLIAVELVDKFNSKSAPLLLLAVWPVMLATYVIVFILSSSATQRFEHLDIFEAWANLQKSALASIAWPLTALALLAPLTLHLFVHWCYVGPASFSEHDLEGFSVWMTGSSVVVALGYFTLVFSSWRFAKRAVGPKGGRELGLSDGGNALIFACVASSLPGVVLWGVPPLIVGVTGTLFIPLSFRLMNRLLWAESDTLSHISRLEVERSASATFEATLNYAFSKSAPITQRVSALSMLVRNYEAARLLPILDSVLEEKNDDLSLIALLASEELGHLPKLRLLAELARTDNISVSTAAIRLLSKRTETEIEKMLVKLMERPYIPVRHTAIEGLGKRGTRAAIPRIRDVALWPGSDRAIRKAADAAICAIQDRTGQKRPGALSLVREVSDGAMSLSESQAGQISLNQD